MATPALAETSQIAGKTAKVIPTDDVTIVGWVDGAPITTDITDVSFLLSFNLASPGGCSFTLGEWAQGRRAFVDPQNPADLPFANAFLLKNTANAAPPTAINPDNVMAAGDYRLFSRLQVAYRVKDGAVIGTPVFVKSNAVVGATIDPCGVVPAVAGDAHALNADKDKTESASGIFQVNQGRIGPLGRAIDTTLNDFGGTIGTTTPWIWNVVKFGLNGNLVFPFSIGSKSNTQIFPTYWVYKNGVRTTTIPQSPLQPFVDLDQASQIANRNEIP